MKLFIGFYTSESLNDKKLALDYHVVILFDENRAVYNWSKEQGWIQRVGSEVQTNPTYHLG